MFNILNLNVNIQIQHFWQRRYKNKLDVDRQKLFGHSSSISTEEVALNSTVIDPFRQRSNRGIILNAFFDNSAQEAISTFSTQSG